MGISTLDGALAGMQPRHPFNKVASPTLVVGRPHSLWYLAGNPGAGSGPANTAGGAVLSSSSALVNGQVPHVDPGSGNAYLARLQAAASQAGTLLLCDRLLHIGGNSGGSAISPTTTTAQTITSTTLPSRDNAGAANGDGVLCALEIAGATGAGLATPAIGYTNSAAAGSKTASLIDPYVASSALGAFYRFGLQAGDIGIKQINTLTLSVSMASGTLALVLYRVLASLELVGAYIPNAIDALTAGFPQLFNGTVPFFVFVPSATAAASVGGEYVETQG